MFEKFAKAVNVQYNAIAKQELYKVDVDLAPVYLAAFPEGTDPLYITNTEHDCSCCKNFLRNLGNVVAITDGKIETVWDLQDVPYPYNIVATKLRQAVLNAPIKQIFRTKERSYGAESTLQQMESGVKKWNHFWGKVHTKHYSASPGQAIGAVEALIHVYKRGLVEFDINTLETAAELIEVNQLYRGAEHRPALNAFRTLWVNYHAIAGSPIDAELYIWATYNQFGAQIRNTVIGTLLQDIQGGMDVEAAVRSFEQKVAPANYKRPTALITESMVKSAMKTIETLGIKDSLDRRMAKLSDISVNDVLWVNNSTQKKMRDSLTDVLLGSVKKRQPSKTSTSMSMEEFVAEAKNYTDIQLFVKNSHMNKFVTLTAPVHADSKPIFKWNNNFAWSYDGDMTDSIKERVKNAGGNVTNAKLRVSLAWHNTDDLDLHMILPNRNRIYFGNKCGILDVDMNVSSVVRNPVENMSFTDANLRDGKYTICVNQYRQRETIDVGCTIEIEYDGHIQQWHYQKALKGEIKFGVITVAGGSITNISVFAPDWTNQGSPNEKWNILTEQYQSVNAITLSPNYWNDSAVGNKHWIFVIDGCKTTDNVRGIYNEYLTQELTPHRKVFEVLGSKTKCKPTDDQVSGLGFSSTQQQELDFLVTTTDGKKKSVKVVV